MKSIEVDNKSLKDVLPKNYASLDLDKRILGDVVDIFTNDWHKTLKADFILANPPFNYHLWNQERLVDDPRWKYGLPPVENANYAWIQHMINYYRK